MKNYLGVVLSATMAVSAARADDGGRGPDVAPVTDKLYLTECGACHMAYPPGLLPARSWQRLMDGLASHFGDDASLGEETRQALREYLSANAADRSGYRRSQKIMRSLAAGEAPLRITEVPYIRRKHAEIPPNYIGANPQVRSLGNCAACHVDAAQGDFGEHRVRIPGVRRGSWEDDD